MIENFSAGSLQNRVPRKTPTTHGYSPNIIRGACPHLHARIGDKTQKNPQNARFANPTISRKCPKRTRMPSGNVCDPE